MLGTRSGMPVPKTTLNVAMIGAGFMGKAHSNAFCQVGHFFDIAYNLRRKVVCARNPAKLEALATRWAWDEMQTDWQLVVERPDVDIIDIAVPNALHAPIALAAANAGKIVFCEKPLGTSLREAQEMADAVRKVPNMVWYNYRRVPAVTFAKQLIDEGRLGRVFHVRSKFLQDWTISADLPQGGAALWRLDVAAAGSGVTGDLLAHCIDTAIWLNGSIKTTNAMTETFIKERKHTLTGKVEKVGIDDACIFMGTFANGSLANFESTRYARGHKALSTLEINGENM